MSITLEQARTLDAIARLGSVSKSAEELHKVHSAVLYTMKSMEEQLGLKLFDRTQYRVGLTSEGRRVWLECKKILQMTEQLDALVGTMKRGWEPFLKVVYDGFLPFEPVMRALSQVMDRKSPTQVVFHTEYLSHVEEIFEKENADLMITVLPPQKARRRTTALPGVRSVLVVHRDHPLAHGKRPWSFDDLLQHTILNVRGSDLRLQLSTAALDPTSLFHLSDFHSKKSALLAGLGYGWMPAYLIERELKQGILKLLKWEGESQHIFRPLIVDRGESRLGPSGQALAEVIQKEFRQFF